MKSKKRKQKKNKKINEKKPTADHYKTTTTSCYYNKKFCTYVLYVRMCVLYVCMYVKGKNLRSYKSISISI